MNDQPDSNSQSPFESLVLVGARPSLFMLLIGLVFVGFLVQQTTLGKALDGFSLVILWIAFTQLKGILDWLRPPRIEVSGNRIRLRLKAWQQAIDMDLSNLANIGLSEGGTVVQFRNLEAVPVSPSMRHHYQLVEQRTGFHLVVPGAIFPLEKMNQIRQLLGLFPQRPLPESEEVRAFVRQLELLTPVPWATCALILANIVVFLLMQTQELAIWNPSPQALIRWGANYGPITLSNEWWRLLTHQFVHIGIMHIAFNMIGLYQMGPMSERLLGRGPYLVGYIFSGACGGICSLIWTPGSVSAGASGAIFGIFGMVLGLLVRRHRSIPMGLVSGFRNSIVMFVVLNIYFSLKIPGIDIAAHAGGFVGGFLFGMAVTPIFVTTSRLLRIGQLVTLIVACTAMCWGMFSLVPPPKPVADLRAAVSAVFTAETELRDRLVEVVDRYSDGKLSPKETATQIRQIITRGWQPARKKFDSLPDLSARQRDLHQAISAYMNAREEAWLLFATAVENDDSALQQEVEAKTDEAMNQLRNWVKLHPESSLRFPEGESP